MKVSSLLQANIHCSSVVLSEHHLQHIYFGFQVRKNIGAIMTPNHITTAKV